MFYETKTTNGNTANFVDRIWIGNWDYETTIREIMPNTNICVLLQLGNIPNYKIIDKEFIKNTPLDFNEWHNKISNEAIFVGNAIIGPHRDMIAELSHGNTYTIGIEFKTGVSHKFFGIPIKELANNIMPLQNANGLLSNIFKQINTNNNNEIFVSLQNFTEDKIMGSPFCNIQNENINNLIRTIDQNPFIHNVNELSELYCTSRRNLNRLFNEYTGLSAQQYIMIEKIKQMANLMIEHSEYSLNDIIALCNYQDQSHLNRDTKQLGGLTATTIYQNLHDRLSYMPSPLAMNLMEGNYCGLHLH